MINLNILAVKRCSLLKWLILFVLLKFVWFEWNVNSISN